MPMLPTHGMKLALEQGRFEDVIEMTPRILAIATDVVHGDIYATKAWAHLRLGQHAECRAAIELAGDNSSANECLQALELAEATPDESAEGDPA